MRCPFCRREMDEAIIRNLRIYFGTDDKTIDIYAYWCSKCDYMEVDCS